jgi:hypothetical protein
MRRVNIASAEYGATGEDNPPGFGCRRLRLGETVGAELLGMTVYEIPPGQSICPTTTSTAGRRDDIMVRRSSGVEYFDGEPSRGG